MTPSRLIHFLAEEIREAVKDYKLIAEMQADKKVTVYEQYMPKDRFEVDTFYPCITVFLQSVEDEGEDSIATVLLRIGVFGGWAEDGWRDLLNIAERLRQHLIMKPIIGGEFQRVSPMAFEPLSVQPEPFFYGNLAARYMIGTPRQNVEWY